MKFQVPRGTFDVMPEEAARWQALEARARAVSTASGYREIRTPIFEATELFAARRRRDDRHRLQGDVHLRRPQGPLAHAAARGHGGRHARLGRARRRPGRPHPPRCGTSGPCSATTARRRAATASSTSWAPSAWAAPTPRPTSRSSSCWSTSWRRSGSRARPCSSTRWAPGLPAGLPGAAARLPRAPRRRDVRRLPRALEKNPLRVLDCKVPHDREVAAGIPSILDSLCAECRDALRRGAGRARRCTACRSRSIRGLVRGLDYYTRTAFEVHDPRAAARRARWAAAGATTG